MTGPGAGTRKPFQEATVRHAVARLLDPSGSRRFLVADEVGLGKTLVAQGILERLSAARHLNVFYVCSSLTIANQNQDRLLEVLPEADRIHARVEVDRPTLLPWTSPSRKAAFTLFTLTPGVLPLGGTSRGRVDERAAIWELLRAGLPGGGTALGRLETKLQLVRDETWTRELGRRRVEPMLGQMRDLAGPFVEEVRKLVKVPDASDQAVAAELNRQFEEEGLSHTIQRLRQCLGRLGFLKLRPDLVILDEFQRFPELITPFRGNDGSPGTPSTGGEEDDEDAHALLHLLLGKRGLEDPPAVLLLSATPYRPPSGLPDGKDHGHHEQFFELLEYLFGSKAGDEVAELRRLFRRFGAELADARPGDPAVAALRANIIQRLGRVVARTERAALLGCHGRVGDPLPVDVPLQASDIRVFRQLWESADPVDRPAAPAYWTSIPYPLQMMDHAYELRKRAVPRSPRSDAASRGLILTPEEVRRYAAPSPPHPRLRGLIDHVGPWLLRLPWLPPTLPWWRLGKPFLQASEASAPEGLSKVLLFSRFRAVPRAIASVLSYEAERASFGGEAANGRRYDYLARRGGGRDASEPAAELEPLPAASLNWQVRRDSGDGLDHPLLALFAPSPALDRIGNPQELPGFAGGTLQKIDALDATQRRLSKALEGLAVRIVGGGRRTGQLWRALVRLERADSATWAIYARELKGWAEKAGSGIARSTVAAWLREGELARPGLAAPVEISEAELEEAAELALAGPGVVLHRAARRVFGAVGDPGVRLHLCLLVALGPLRTYLDEPEFHRFLAVLSRQVPNHPADIRHAVWNGNLEAVLDEYFALQAGLGSPSIDPGREQRALKALETALSIRTSTVRVQALDGQTSFGLRCHAAMAFGLGSELDRSSGDGGDARPDSLRQAFNAPFRPFVLATTSIGQEGLDFHQYCDRLVHWDLPSSPVDLEQRDGRINRYGGLAVRKALAARRQDRPDRIPSNGSPWLTLASEVEVGAEGMAPWWGTPGASLHRSVFLPPLARQRGELARLLASLSFYRLALGQANPSQLISALQRKRDMASLEERRALEEWLQAVQIDLAPGRHSPGA